MATRRVYSETLPYAELVRPNTVRLLARYGLEVVLAVRPWDLADLPLVARSLRDAGVTLSIWPMLSDEEGRWANVHNAASFSALTLSACDLLAQTKAPPRDVLFDLEPPFAEAQSLAAVSGSKAHDLEPKARGEASLGLFGRLASGWSRSAHRAFDAAGASLARSVDELHARGIATSMAVWPLVALDPPGIDTWQAVLGTPVDVLGTGHVSVMMYTSILEGWSRGAVRRRDARALLSAGTSRSIRRWGARAGISLGCVGAGALEDEPTYRDPVELADDVSVARAAGCEQLSLFDLGGVMARPPAEAWFEAFVSEPSASDREGAGARLVHDGSTTRVRVVRSVARAATWALVQARAIRVARQP